MSDEIVSDYDAVYATMHSVLDSVNAVFEQEGYTLPERQYIALGEVIDDCAQLTVSLLQMYSGAPGDQAEAPTRCVDPKSVTLQVRLLRSIPVRSGRASAPVTPEEFDESTHRLTGDAFLLLQGVMASTAVDFLGGLADVTIADPAGGFQAITVSLVCGVR